MPASSATAAFPVHEEPGAFSQIAVEPVADEAEIVFVAPHFACAIEAVLLDDAFPDGEAEVIRIHGERRLLTGRVRPHNVGVCLERLEISRLRQEVGLSQE